MRIALYAGSLIKGGTERVLVTLAHNFIKNGHEVYIVTTFRVDNEYPIDERITRIISSLNKEEETKSRIINIIKRFSKLKGIWKDINPDVVLSFIGKNNFNALLTAGRMGIPVAVSVRADPKMEYPDKLSRLLARWLYPKADSVILQTKDSLTFFNDKVRAKAVILKNPINPSFYGREYIEYKNREKKIVAIGRVDENKNQEMLIRAYNCIKDSIPEYSLVIHGNGDKREYLLGLVKELGLEDRISLPGVSEDVPQVVSHASLFVLCSDTEGVPNTLLEAMAVGTAVISTDCPCGGPREIIRERENGYLVPVRDIEALAVRMKEALSDIETLEAVAKEAKITAEAYREDTVSLEWFEELKRLGKK